MLVPDADYISYFLDGPVGVVELETIEISHPNFTKDYFLVRNKRDGLDATLETAAPVSFAYNPMKLEPTASNETLDYGIDVTFGDLGTVLPTEFDAVASAQGFGTKPALVYRSYRSDDLTAPMVGPLTLEIKSVAFAEDGAKFLAQAPALNINKTGEFFDFDRFPMLMALI